MKQNLLENVTDLTLYTGTFGRKKCTCSCIGCTQESYGNRHKDFQGNLQQIQTIIEKLPNLKNAYILGNPDVSVDTHFCNLVAKKFIEHGKKVMFSTSGYQAMETLKVLLREIEPKNIEYISYSIDTTDLNKLQYLKGTKNINLEEIEKAIKYCNIHNIKVKIQPTLWEINQDDYKEIINYFYTKFNIDWFTFHVGSFESLLNKQVPLKHVKPEKWREISQDINHIAQDKKLKIVVPKIFLNEAEYMRYKKDSKTYCTNGGAGIQIWLQKEGIKATFCPLLAETTLENTVFDIEKEDVKLAKTENEKCSCCSQCIDMGLKENSVGKNGTQFMFQNEKLYNVCRFYSYREDYR